MEPGRLAPLGLMGQGVTRAESAGGSERAAECRAHSLRYQGDSWLASAMCRDLHACLRPERAEAVDAWLRTPLGACRLCGESAYLTDSRQRDPAESDEDVVALVHLPCLRAAEADE
jgi:hypothetical protein